MSEVPPATSLDLEQLKRDAEAQQRRRAPPLAGQQSKKRRLDDPDAADDEQDEEGPVSRFSYAADTEIAAGSTCFMASCGFNRWAWGQRREMTDDQASGHMCVRARWKGACAAYRRNTETHAQTAQASASQTKRPPCAVCCIRVTGNAALQRRC